MNLAQVLCFLRDRKLVSMLCRRFSGLSGVLAHFFAALRSVFSELIIAKLIRAALRRIARFCSKKLSDRRTDRER
jgi:hypothetical protein